MPWGQKGPSREVGGNRRGSSGRGDPGAWVSEPFAASLKTRNGPDSREPKTSEPSDVGSTCVPALAGGMGIVEIAGPSDPSPRMGRLAKLPGWVFRPLRTPSNALLTTISTCPRTASDAGPRPSEGNGDPRTALSVPSEAM